MSKRNILLFSSLATLVGCAQVSGIWALEIPQTEDAEACEPTVSHNFNDATVSEDPGDTGGSDLVVEEESSGSPLVVAVAIEETSASTANLVVGSQIYPGTKEKDGWTFSWERKGNHTQTTTFETSYTLVEESTTNETTTYVFDIKGDTLTGTIKTVSKSESSWTETDEWGDKVAETVGTRGAIPSGLYLVNADGDPVNNRNSEAECAGGNCELSLNLSCNDSGNVTGFRTGFNVEDLGELGLDAGQLPGGF